MAPKLASKHITMPPFSHLRVCLAAQILSHSVAAGISAMVTLKALPPEAIETAKFAEQFDRLFNCFNSSSLTSKNVIGHGITASSTHASFLEQSLEWLSQVQCNNTSQSLPCLEGWRLSISCLLKLWKDLRENLGFRYLLTDRLNQDCLENLFAVIRSKGGNRFNPEAYEFKAALRQCMVDSVMTSSERQNCKEDLDSFLFSLENLASKGSNAAIRNRLQQNVPRNLHMLMMPTAVISLSSVESNIVVYIAGYVASKLSSKVCTGCKELLIGVSDFASKD
ncbi:transposable element P transposase-like Protein [Elysia marginata]|uniref:Transposable element P transposase-like Protein n=1 Tax=Elysia marginata TaxID=1093978 RepID=A0AAV4GBV9_9GAST|nr:transposable element P transposase-like Protein [Elysia marginata]